MISFAGKVKNELCRVGISRQCCARAEGYGVLLYGNTFTPGEIRIITENGDFAARLPKLFQKAFGVKIRPGTGGNERQRKADLRHHSAGKAGKDHQHTGL